MSEPVIPESIDLNLYWYALALTVVAVAAVVSNPQSTVSVLLGGWAGGLATAMIIFRWISTEEN